VHTEVLPFCNNTGTNMAASANAISNTETVVSVNACAAGYNCAFTHTRSNGAVIRANHDAFTHRCNCAFIRTEDCAAGYIHVDWRHKSDNNVLTLPSPGSGSSTSTEATSSSSPLSTTSSLMSVDPTAGGGDPTGAIIGGVLGALAVLLILVAIAVAVARRKRKSANVTSNAPEKQPRKESSAQSQYQVVNHLLSDKEVYGDTSYNQVSLRQQPHVYESATSALT
jgi:hypothetical protein